jgi:hypothetical protein
MAINFLFCRKVIRFAKFSGLAAVPLPMEHKMTNRNETQNKQPAPNPTTIGHGPLFDLRTLVLLALLAVPVGLAAWMWSL